MTTVTYKTRIAAALALMAIPAAAQAEPGDSAGRIGAYNDTVIAIMKAKLPLPARAERFETVVKAYYDMPGIAALVAGPAWASASTEDKWVMIGPLTWHLAGSLARKLTR